MFLFFSVIASEDKKSKIECLYSRYSGEMFSVAYRILNDYQLAQDAVQTAFINIMEKIEKINEIDCHKTRAFVVIIVRNISINLYRKRKKQNDLMLEDIGETVGGGELIVDTIINAEAFSQVASAIKDMHPAYTDVITLRYYYGYSDKEISELLSITHDNVRTRIRRAKQSLISKLSANERKKESE